jgi:uncharacterized protein YigE (DUF2233 family)
VRTDRQSKAAGRPRWRGKPVTAGSAEGASVRAKARRSLAAARLIALLALTGLCAPAFAIDCSRVVAAGHALTVCRAGAKTDSIQLFLNDESGHPFHTFAALEKSLAAQGKRLAFAMNAGMFEPDYSPVGLYIEQGKTLAPLNLKDERGNFFLKPNGVFYLNGTGAGVVQSTEVAQVATPVTLATQSGPMLVIKGQIHYRLTKTSTSRYLRNGVGIDANGKVVFAVSEAPLTLYEFAVAFRDDLHCPNALYLDGSITSVYAPSLNQRIQRADLGPIVAIVE